MIWHKLLQIISIINSVAKILTGAIEERALNALPPLLLFRDAIVMAVDDALAILGRINIFLIDQDQ